MSYGQVMTKDDLYSPKIFGPSHDNKCECGKYEGSQNKGIICDICGVKIHDDANYLRNTRLGHILLAFPIRHPFDKKNFIEAFYIAPINMRIMPGCNLKPTPLGLKYEKLVEYNESIRSSLPDKYEQPEEYYMALKEKIRPEDQQKMQYLIKDIIGNLSDDIPSIIEPDTIIGHLVSSLWGNYDNIPLYFYMMGFGFHYRGYL
jgi:hypothetical protein